MIYDTLAAMADWIEDRKHDSQAQDVTINDTNLELGLKIDRDIVRPVTEGGNLVLQQEVLTVGSRVLNNDQVSDASKQSGAFLDKAPISTVQTDTSASGYGIGNWSGGGFG